MAWTTQRPTQAGFYFYRDELNLPFTIVERKELYPGDPHAFFEAMGREDGVPGIDEGWPIGEFWDEPIPPPPET